MRVLITGGNGFIGSHFADRLVELGHHVALLDLKFGEHARYLEPNLVRGDVCDDEIFQRVKVLEPEVILHAAAVSRVEWGELDPDRCLKVNTMGVLNVIEWATKMEKKPHVIYASSREVYGEPRSIPVAEDHSKEPKSIYGISKLMGEKLLAHYALTSGLRYTILRFSNVYGSTRDLPERVTPRFVGKALRGETLTVYGGDQVLDFTFIDDVVDGLTRLIALIENQDQSVLNNDLHFTTCKGCSIADLARLVNTIVGLGSEIKIMQGRDFDVKRFIGDYSKAKRILGYTPKVSLEDGLRKYIETVAGN
jgi:nucleoside-diphosphate-sugar epimerase